MREGGNDGPIVSVIVPAYNIAPWIEQCVSSVAVQSIGTDTLELIVVDDGSTDATPTVLDALGSVNPWMRVVHQPNSGGPGAPRNTGLDVARGRYVFFLDGDDYLGPEALERLVAMAEKNTSDIVVARIIGVEGRAKPGALRYNRDVDRATLDYVNMSANTQKLFRRSFIEDAGLRFEPGVTNGEDADFMQRAYLQARVVSVLGSYDAYFIRLRQGSQTSRTDRTDDIGEAILRIERDRILPVAERIEAGPRRDHLLRQHVAKVAQLFGGRWAALDPADQVRVFETGAAVARRWTSPAIEQSLAPKQRVRLHCLLHGLLAELRDIAAAPAATVFGAPVIDRGRIYAAYPHFRDSSGIPDACFDMTRLVNLKARVDDASDEDGHLVLEGSARLHLVGGRPVVRLRRWPAGPEVSIEVVPVATPDLRDRTRSYPEAGFRVEVDLATVHEGGPLPGGIWEVLVGAQAADITRKRPARLASGSVRVRGVRRRPEDGPELVLLRGGGLQLHVPPVSVMAELAERFHRRSTRLRRRAGVRVRARRPHR